MQNVPSRQDSPCEGMCVCVCVCVHVMMRWLSNDPKVTEVTGCVQDTTATTAH